MQGKSDLAPATLVNSEPANERYSVSMPDSPYGAMPPGPAPWPQQGLRPARGPSRLPIFLTLGVALVALGLAIGGWFRPTTTTAAGPTTPQYSEQEVADAKKNLCDAYDTIYRSLEQAGTTTSEDPNQKYMIALNTRLAFNTSADFLLGELSRYPATPADLQSAVRKAALSYQNMVLKQIANAPKDELDAAYSEVDSGHADLKTACK